MNNYQLDKATVASVVAHMNQDHGDACLAIVRALGACHTSHQAVMQSMDVNGVDFVVIHADGGDQLVRIPFDKPISRDSQIRGYLVALTKRARALLHQTPDH